MYQFSQGSSKIKKQDKKKATSSSVVAPSSVAPQPTLSTALQSLAPAMAEEAKNQALSDISISKSRGPW